MILCIDSGNSRIKYGLWDGHAWVLNASCSHADSARLGELLDQDMVPARIMLSNVAGVAAEARIRTALGSWGEQLEVVSSTALACGVRNGYREPARLGVDRWCALIGARALRPGALLVVMAGTATTIDTLDAAGNFLGGLILPGQQLMLAALARDTAALPFAAGQYDAWPTGTDDAIVSGAIEAQAGAIERAWQRLQGSERHCLLSGGNAKLLLPHLAMAASWTDNLPMLGLKELACENSSESHF